MSMQKFALQRSSAVLLTEAKKWKHPNAEQPVSGKTVAYPYNRILFAHRNSSSANMCYSMDAHGRHYNK